MGETVTATDWAWLEDILDALEVQAAEGAAWRGHEPQARLVLRSNGSGFIEICSPVRRMVVTRWSGDVPSGRREILEDLANRLRVG